MLYCKTPKVTSSALLKMLFRFTSLFFKWILTKCGSWSPVPFDLPKFSKWTWKPISASFVVRLFSILSLISERKVAKCKIWRVHLRLASLLENLYFCQNSREKLEKMWNKFRFKNSSVFLSVFLLFWISLGGSQLDFQYKRHVIAD